MIEKILENAKTCSTNALNAYIHMLAMNRLGTYQPTLIELDNIAKDRGFFFNQSKKIWMDLRIGHRRHT